MVVPMVDDGDGDECAQRLHVAMIDDGHGPYQPYEMAPHQPMPTYQQMVYLWALLHFWLWANGPSSEEEDDECRSDSRSTKSSIIIIRDSSSTSKDSMQQ